MPTPAKIESRLVSGLKKFQPIIESAKDINESDTVTIVKDVLSEIFEVAQ